MRPLAVIAALALLFGACSAEIPPAPVIAVPGDYPTLAAAIHEAPDGATIRLAPGRYVEQVVIDRPVTILAEPGTVELVGIPGSTVITIAGTTGVTLQGLTIVGGDTGVAVMHSSDVTIADNIIVESGYRGVDVVSAAATVIGNQIKPAPGPYVIGIRVANATSWPDSVISSNVVDHAGGYGIAVNFANAMVKSNDVIGGNRAGIAINEMSLADVLGNTVNEAPRYGILVHDMSHAVVTDNRIVGAEEPIKLTFHSTAELSGNETD
ncbi:MAG: right-handed parallel beta-helix repeat-containing protein [Actinobacteria bacterium]|nr:right-handed parallel beta-helix repeat-containing protein [Actinomycetota bacterium]